MQTYRSIDEIKRANARTGQGFFDDPKVQRTSDVIEERFFVSYMPERGPPNHAWFVHEVDDRGEVFTHAAGPYDTQAQAAIAIAGRMGNGRWMENPSLRPSSDRPDMTQREEGLASPLEHDTIDEPILSDELPHEIALADELQARERHVREGADRAPNERIRAYRLGKADAYREMRIALECGYTLDQAHEKVLDLKPGTAHAPRPSGWERDLEQTRGMRLRRHL